MPMRLGRQAEAYSEERAWVDSVPELRTMHDLPKAKDIAMPVDYAAEQKEVEARFEHYWNLLGKSSPGFYIDLGTVPTEESFKAMLYSAYSMGWTESRCALSGDYPMPGESKETNTPPPPLNDVHPGAVVNTEGS